jgi:hypothetical protein
MCVWIIRTESNPLMTEVVIALDRVYFFVYIYQQLLK